MKPRRAGERGETLLELLITIAIMGSVVVAVLAGIAVAVNSSDENKKDVGVQVVLRDFAEAVTASSYAGCTPPTPASVGYPSPQGYTLSAQMTGAYDPVAGTWSSTCTNTGTVRIRLTATTTDATGPHQRSRSLEVVKVKDYVRPS